jgi:cellobiose phosphorylase
MNMNDFQRITKMENDLAALRQSLERVNRNDEVDGLKRRVDRLEELVQNADTVGKFYKQGCGEADCKICSPLGKETKP